MADEGFDAYAGRGEVFSREAQWLVMPLVVPCNDESSTVADNYVTYGEELRAAVNYF